MATGLEVDEAGRVAARADAVAADQHDGAVIGRQREAVQVGDAGRQQIDLAAGQLPQVIAVAAAHEHGRARILGDDVADIVELVQHVRRGALAVGRGVPRHLPHDKAGDLIAGGPLGRRGQARTRAVGGRGDRPPAVVRAADLDRHRHHLAVLESPEARSTAARREAEALAIRAQRGEQEAVDVTQLPARRAVRRERVDRRPEVGGVPLQHAAVGQRAGVDVGHAGVRQRQVARRRRVRAQVPGDHVGQLVGGDQRGRVGGEEQRLEDGPGGAQHHVIAGLGAPQLYAAVLGGAGDPGTFGRPDQSLESQTGTVEATIATGARVPDLDAVGVRQRGPAGRGRQIDRRRGAVASERALRGALDPQSDTLGAELQLRALAGPDRPRVYQRGRRCVVGHRPHEAAVVGRDRVQGAARAVEAQLADRRAERAELAVGAGGELPADHLAGLVAGRDPLAVGGPVDRTDGRAVIDVALEQLAGPAVDL